MADSKTEAERMQDEPQASYRVPGEGKKKRSVSKGLRSQPGRAFNGYS